VRGHRRSLPGRRAGASPEANLRTIARHGVRPVLEKLDRQILQRVLAESRDFPDPGRSSWETGPAKFESLVAGQLQDAKSRGLLDIDGSARVAAGLVGQITGVYLLPMPAGVAAARPRLRSAGTSTTPSTHS
jgi:hypothetical protein